MGHLSRSSRCIVGQPWTSCCSSQVQRQASSGSSEHSNKPRDELHSLLPNSAVVGDVAANFSIKARCFLTQQPRVVHAAELTQQAEIYYPERTDDDLHSPQTVKTRDSFSMNVLLIHASVVSTLDNADTEGQHWAVSRLPRPVEALITLLRSEVKALDMLRCI